MKKPIIALMTAIAFLALTASSCGSKDEPDPEPDPAEQPDQKPDPEPEPEPTFKEEPDDPASDYVGLFNYSSLKSMGHPRLFMNAADFEDLKNKVTVEKETHKALYDFHGLIMNLAISAVNSTTQIEYKLDAAGKRLLEQSQLALVRLTSCAYAYRMTGNNKYLQHADADLRRVCMFQDWHPSHYLDTGEMALAVAVAYDWLYEYLSYDTRVLARKALCEFAIKTSSGQSYHTSTGNWNQVCNAGIIAAAIACYEKDKQTCGSTINTGVKDNATAMKAIYSPDGNYTEGYDYWGYGTDFEMLIIGMLEKCFGSDNHLSEVAGFSKTPSYMLFMAGANGSSFGYADGGVTTERPKLAMWWFAAKQKDPSLLLNERRMMAAGKYPTSDEKRIFALAIGLIKDFDGLDTDSGTVPSSNFWYGEGATPVAMIHTGWKFNEEDVYVGIKGGRADSSHGHMDAGSFVFDINGSRWSEDLSRPSYANIETALKNAGGNFWTMTQKSLRWDVFRMNNLCHSTIAIMNKDGSVSGKVHESDHVVTGSATFTDTYNTPEKMGVRMNMSNVLLDGVASEYRTIVLENGHDLVITDEISAKSGMDAKVRWNMLTKAVGEASGQTMLLTLGGRKMNMSVESSDSGIVPVCEAFGEAKRPDSWTSRSWDPSNTGYYLVGYTVTVPAGKTVTIKTTLSAQ